MDETHKFIQRLETLRKQLEDVKSSSIIPHNRGVWHTWDTWSTWSTWDTWETWNTWDTWGKRW